MAKSWGPVASSFVDHAVAALTAAVRKTNEQAQVDPWDKSSERGSDSSVVTKAGERAATHGAPHWSIARSVASGANTTLGAGSSSVTSWSAIKEAEDKDVDYGLAIKQGDFKSTGNTKISKGFKKKQYETGSQRMRVHSGALMSA